MHKTIRIRMTGRVQGVGFRPFVFSLAKKYGISGIVQNNMDGVCILAQAEEEQLQRMEAELKALPPRLSRLDQIHIEEVEEQLFPDFRIIPSEKTGTSSLVIPVDSAVCDECLSEMWNPSDFRYLYPFINCTQCGPRYTIIGELPYDRPHTSMHTFPMCASCQKEYEDPANRRHHAQPIACPACGPKLRLLDRNGSELAGDPLELATQFLQEGAILAIKGLGGYHLACDAFQDDAVLRLRKRKNRPNRPLAIMAASLQEAESLCSMSSQEAEILLSPERPIVILDVKEKPEKYLSPYVAPGMRTLGVMLPYTPLHHLLLTGRLSHLVMTSANPSGLPILFQDDLAGSYLEGIADYILAHDREILHPLDDSVVRVEPDVSFFIRRSRGYVPDPISTEHKVHGVIALGGQQKNTFAIGRRQQIFLGPHIGDMESEEVLDFHQTAREHLQKWLGTDPAWIAVDKHPGYAATRLAAEMPGRILPVQHHHAHMVSCMEDNGISEPCWGIILDGTGYGDDGNIWGFEILYGTSLSYYRAAHLRYTPLPGGEGAIKDPWKNAFGMLIHYFGDQGMSWAKQLFPEFDEEMAVLKKMLDNKWNAPMAGTCGRLFDAVSALLGICRHSSYEGEAAISLSERMGQQHLEEAYPFALLWKQDEHLMEIDFKEGLQHIVDHILSGVNHSKIIGRFHQTVASMCCEALIQAALKAPGSGRKVVLSGGSFHNPQLSKEVARRLRLKGFQVHSHQKVPCNDGGLALGQLIIAASKKEEMEREETGNVHRRSC